MEKLILSNSSMQCGVLNHHVKWGTLQHITSGCGAAFAFQVIKRTNCDTVDAFPRVPPRLCSPFWFSITIKYHLNMGPPEGDAGFTFTSLWPAINSIMFAALFPVCVTTAIDIVELINTIMGGMVVVVFFFSNGILFIPRDEFKTWTCEC